MEKELAPATALFTNLWLGTNLLPTKNVQFHDKFFENIADSTKVHTGSLENSWKFY